MQAFTQLRCLCSSCYAAYAIISVNLKFNYFALLDSDLALSKYSLKLTIG